MICNGRVVVAEEITCYLYEHRTFMLQMGSYNFPCNIFGPAIFTNICKNILCANNSKGSPFRLQSEIDGSTKYQLLAALPQLWQGINLHSML